MIKIFSSLDCKEIEKDFNIFVKNNDIRVDNITSHITNNNTLILILEYTYWTDVIGI